MVTPRRLVRLITRLNIGGPARQALLLSKSLEGWETVLAAGSPRNDEGELLDPSVPVRRVPLVRPLDPVHDVRALAAVTRLLRAERPALVHTHMAKAGTVGRLAALSMRRRPILVHTFHGHVLEGYFRPAVQRGFIAVERQLARRTDLLVAVSTEIREQLLDLGIGDPDRFRVVPLGLKLDAHRRVTGPTGALRALIGVSPETPLVGSVGRLVPIKDIGLLLDAIERVPGAHLAIVGDGELRGELERSAARRDLAGRVHFTGWLLDIPSVMADLDVVALTSRNEGTPVSLIEAAACGRAAVATDVGGVRSVVDHGETGLVVPRDADAIAEAIASLLADANRRGALGAAGRERSHRFDARRLVADIASLYDELLPH